MNAGVGDDLVCEHKQERCDRNAHHRTGDADADAPELLGRVERGKEQDGHEGDDHPVLDNAFAPALADLGAVDVVERSLDFDEHGDRRVDQRQHADGPDRAEWHVQDVVDQLGENLYKLADGLVLALF